MILIFEDQYLYEKLGGFFMTDQLVLETQKWLNKTYGSVKGFEKVPENGKTGWKTIYGLREGLQHELGLTELAEGFGTQTKAALSQKIVEYKKGYKGNVAKLIKGAFWCKGISPQNFTNVFDDDLVNAIKVLQKNAGISQTGTLTVNLMEALFDMSAFTLVENGDSNVRHMQQDLNSRYSNDIGIQPCDGIYQRATNTALIYALQRTIGIDSNTANGTYGPNTIKLTPTVYEGTTGYIVTIIQYGLYVNGFGSGSFNGVFDSSVASSIIAFRKFMNLAPVDSSVADLTVIKGLLTSNGNTARDSDTFDTSTPLNLSDARNLKSQGFNIIGRYLTGTVGVGAEKRDKSLSLSEIENLTSAGLNIFPIYEDGGYETDYFSSSQGFYDAKTAVNAAIKLGFPAGTVIYFAVDVDIQEGDIDGTIVPYINSLIETMKGTQYTVGIYGTRNVCLHAQKLGVNYSFVADMSYGWSGNLGFKMPNNWSFDQFVEYTDYGIAIDQDASSGRDKGQNKFDKTINNSITKINDIWNQLKQYAPFNLVSDYTFSIENQLYKTKTPLVDLELSLSLGVSQNFSNSAVKFSVTNDNVNISLSDKLHELLLQNNIACGNSEITSQLNKIGSTIHNGVIAMNQSITSNGLQLIYQIGSSIQQTNSDGSSSKLEYTIILKMNFHEFISNSPIDLPATTTTQYNLNLNQVCHAANSGLTFIKENAVQILTAVGITLVGMKLIAEVISVFALAVA